MTSQNAKLDRIKARIKALSERTVERGCTEAEASAAADMMGKLLTEYSLTMTDVDVRAANCRTLTIDSGAKAKNHLTLMIVALANFADCKAWFSPACGSTNLRYNFFGQESDLQVIEYLFAVIKQSAETEAARFRKTDAYRLSYSKASATHAFKTGMVSRVAERLRQMKAERVAEASKAAGMGCSLVVLKDQVVTEEYAALNLRTKKSPYRPAVRSATAHDHGRAAGDRVGLSRPVTGGNGGALRLS